MKSRRAWGIAAASLITILIGPPLLWRIDEEAFVTVAAIAIIVLPFLDGMAAVWYAMLWWRSRSLVLGMSAVFGALTAFGLALAVLPASRRVADLEPLPAGFGVFLIGWGYVVMGAAPFLTAAWLALEAWRQRPPAE